LETHVYNCEICKGRGHICEMCKGKNGDLNGKYKFGEKFDTIFNFSENVKICEICCSIFHLNCWYWGVGFGVFLKNIFPKNQKSKSLQ